MYEICSPRDSWISAALLLSKPSSALVRTPAPYEKALSSAAPGDTIVPANDAWRNIELEFKGKVI